MRPVSFFLSLVLVAAHLLCSLRAAGADINTASPAGHWLAVTAPGFRDCLSPLIEARRAEGLKVSVIETTNGPAPGRIAEGDAQPLWTQIRDHFKDSAGPNYVLLVGNVKASSGSTNPDTVVPAMTGKVGRMKGLATDYAYCLPLSNGAPTLAVGRFPGRTVAEIQAMVRKTLRFERESGPAEWQNRLLLIQGNPGGGPLAEMLVEQAAAPRLRRLHSYFNLEAISHSSASIYYVPDSRLRETCLGSLQSGQFFALYLGHSDASGLWSGNSYFLRRDDWARMKTPHGNGPFFTCGCFACQEDGAQGGGYGLAAIRNPAGPVAVIGASGESYSAAGLLAVDGLLRQMSAPPFPARLADYWLAVQTGLAVGEIDSGTFAIYDQFDGSGGKVPLPVQRLEHLEMWMLLGDPALRLPAIPQDLALDSVGPIRAGERVPLSGTLPDRLKGAMVRASVERQAGSKPGDWQELPANSPAVAATRDQVAVENSRKANQLVLAATETKSEGNRFACALELPATMTWSNVVIRVYATNATQSAIGVRVCPTNL